MGHKEKTCVVCGKSFFPTGNRQEYCSLKCKNEIKYKNDVMQKSIERQWVDDYVGDNIYIDENKWRSPPTEEDIYKIILLLKEFGIKEISPPKFTNVLELYKWKNQKISEVLR